MTSRRVVPLLLGVIVFCAIGAGGAQAASLPAAAQASTSFELRDTLTGGPATNTFSYGTRPNVPLMGDWDGDGVRTPGSYEAGVFKLRDSNSAGAADVTFTHGDARGFPVAGDFDGDGVDDVAVYRTGSWQVRLSTGTTLLAFAYGSGSWPATIPVAGDWNGDGVDGIGTYTYATASWSLRNSASLGPTDIGPFAFGTGNSTYPVVGDWNHDGTDTVAVCFSGATPTWEYRNANSAGGADGTFVFGSANALPLSWTSGNPPTDITLSNASIAENAPSGTGVGTLAAVDPDVNNTHAFTLVAGAGDSDNGSFEIVGTTLQSKASFDFEAKSSYLIRVGATDSTGKTLEKQFTIAITDVNEAPLVTNDSYSGAVGNTKATRGVSVSGEPVVTLTGNVLTANDSDPDGDALSTVPETAASTGGGTATIGSDGTFTFTPGVGDKSQSDTFAYKATDGSLQTTGTVTVAISDNLVWYVNRNLASNGDGRSISPRNNLAGINGAGGAGDLDAPDDFIFLYGAASAYTGGLPLESSQKLVGQPQGLIVNGVTLLPAGGSNPVIQNSGGNAITLASGVMTRRVDVGTTSGDGISGTNITTADIGPNTSISGVSGVDFKVSGGSGAITFGPAITNTSARSVDIQNRTGGTVTLSGAINDTGTGVFLNANAGATVAFTGDVDVSSMANPAFTATGGGTVTATNTGSTLTSTTGRALNVANTTIGSGGLKFRSIAANGAASGIVLNNTGTTAGLTVSGTGAAGSGGTIQNTTGPGISLTNTDKVSLNNIAITGADRAGINGTGVTDFSFTNGSITNAGDAKVNAADAAFAFNSNPAAATNNVDGPLTITGNTVTNPYGGGVDIFNRAGTISNANISNNTITSATTQANSKEDGISLNLFGLTTSVASLTKATINSNTINNFPSGGGIAVEGANTAGASAPAGTYGTRGSATDVVTISGNLIKGNPGTKLNNNAIATGVTGRGQGNFAITGNGTADNPLANVVGGTIGAGVAGDADATFTITGNFIAPNNEVGSAAIGLGTDKNLQADGSTLADPDVDATISSNTITNANGRGINVLQSSSNGSVNLKLQNNDISTLPASAGTSILIENGSSSDPAFNPSVCANISGNKADAGGPDAFGHSKPGIVLLKDGTPSTYPFRIVGLSPSPASASQTETYVTTQNPDSGLGGGFFAGKRVAVILGDTFSSCAPLP